MRLYTSVPSSSRLYPLSVVFPFAYPGFSCGLISTSIQYSTHIRTNDEFAGLHALVSLCVVARSDQHMLDTLRSPLLAELHLKDSMVDGFPRDLSAQVVQLAM